MTIINRKAVQAKTKLIEPDIALERFDYTLTKYGRPQPPQFTVVESLKTQSMMVRELWQRFAADTMSGLKPKTRDKYEHLTRIFEKSGDLTIDDPLIVKQFLEQVTTIFRTKDGLMYLSAAYK